MVIIFNPIWFLPILLPHVAVDYARAFIPLISTYDANFGAFLGKLQANVWIKNHKTVFFLLDGFLILNGFFWCKAAMQKIFI